MRHERALIDWIGEKLGGEDIDFPNDDEFSSAYVLQGDTERVRQLFNREVRRFFLRNKDEFATFEANKSAVMIDYGSRIHPKDCVKLVGFARDALAVIGAAQP
jgi:hypothetical protein